MSHQEIEKWLVNVLHQLCKGGATVYLFFGFTINVASFKLEKLHHPNVSSPSVSHAKSNFANDTVS